MNYEDKFGVPITAIDVDFYDNLYDIEFINKPPKLC